MKKRFNKNLTMKKKKNNSNHVTLAGFVKNLLIMTMKRLESLSYNWKI